MKIDTVKKIRSYLNFYGSNRDIIFFKYRIVICQTKRLGKENVDYETILEK